MTSLADCRFFFALIAMGQVNKAISFLVNCNKYMMCSAAEHRNWYNFSDLDEVKDTGIYYTELDRILLAFAKYRVLQQLHWQRFQFPGQWQAFLSGTDLALGADSAVLSLRGNYWAIMKNIRTQIEVTTEDVKKVSRQITELLTEAEGKLAGFKDDPKIGYVSYVKNALDEVASNGGNANCLTNAPLKQLVQVWQ